MTSSFGLGYVVMALMLNDEFHVIVTRFDPEPLGHAHTNPCWTSMQIKTAILEPMDVSIETREAIAHSLRTMFGLKASVMCEGGSEVLSKLEYPWPQSADLNVKRRSSYLLSQCLSR
ncbi:acetyl-coenzyme A carboxylase carboxyl transferase subunit alpha, chloroplastic [Tanacetum coccineum]